MSAIFGVYYSRPYLPEVVQTYHRLAKAERPDSLHHYSTAAGAIGILDTKAIWATNANYLNDSLELAYGLNVVRTLLQDRYPTSDGVTRSWIKQVEKILQEMIAANAVYLACFCETPDLLSQWRGYGADGGVCLSLGAGVLAEDERNVLIRVLYDPAEQKRLVLETLAEFEANVSAAIQGADDFGPLRENAKLSTALALLVSSFKHPSFSEEREWRILPLVLPPVSFRVDDGWVKPYVSVELTFDRIVLPPLRAVTIGPGRHAALTKQSIAMLLEAKGYKGVPVKVSHVPLR